MDLDRDGDDDGRTMSRRESTIHEKRIGWLLVVELSIIVPVIGYWAWLGCPTLAK